ncbi:MAG TPA: DUF4833 domain-containing protein [Thermoanaerobaculia bacterium]|jgi:hypothetical protein
MLPIVLLAVHALMAPARAGGVCSPHLFVLERSTNANIVVYDAKRLPAGDLDPAKPVVAYWIRNAEKGQRKELNAIQWSRAYGFDTEPATEPGTHRMTFKAKLDRSFVVQIIDGCPAAVTRIAGQEAILRRVYVHVKTTFFLPSVESIEMFGDDLETGAPVHDEFRP